MAAPVVMRFNISSGVLLKSTTICKLLLVEPSFKAIKELFLKVRTHPFTIIVCSVGVVFNISFIRIRAIIKLELKTKFTKFSI